MSVGRGDERLLSVIRKLYRELGYAELATDGPSAAWRGPSQSAPWGDLDGREFVARMREELATLAWVANGESEGDESGERAVAAALDGAELVMRGELASQRDERVAAHLPGFVFTVTYSGLGRERAIALSRRAAELIEAGAAPS